MSKPGKVRPGSVKSIARDHWREVDLMRGGHDSDTQKFEIETTSEHLGDAKEEKLYAPESEPVQPLYSHDDLVRGKIVTFTFTLLATLLVFGTAAITVLSILHVPTGQVTKFLETLLPQLMAIVTFAAGYYFGKRKN